MIGMFAAAEDRGERNEGERICIQPAQTTKSGLASRTFFAKSAS